MRLADVTIDQRDGPDDVKAVCQALSNRAAFEPVYWRYRDRVYRYLLTRTPQEADAADLTQHVFLRALDQLHQYRQTRGSVAAWLFGIARHSASDFHRKHRRHLNTEDDLSAVLEAVAPESTEADVIHRDDIRVLGEALAGLSNDKREILALRFAAELTIPEIAAVIGKSAAATRKQLRRTIQSLEDHYRDTTP